MINKLEYINLALLLMMCIACSRSDLKEGIIYGLAALSLELFLIVILILVKNKKKLVALSEKFKDIDIDNDK